jgi:hypothetical protein
MLAQHLQMLAQTEQRFLIHPNPRCLDFPKPSESPSWPPREVLAGVQLARAVDILRGIALFNTSIEN